jgi:hypothetical protein
MHTTTIEQTMGHGYVHSPIKILHRLKAAGFSQEQAEAQVEIFTDYVENGLATKKDLGILENKIEDRLKSFDYRIEAKLKALELRMFLQTSGIVGFFYALEKFF